MHNPDYVPASGINATHNVDFALPVHQPLDVRFSSKQSVPSGQRKLGEIFAEKVAAKEFFYGIEMTARSYGQQQLVLDYDSFGALLPLFSSLVWLGADYADVANIEDVESIQLAHHLYPHIIVLPHFTCYRLDYHKVNQFLDQNFTNVLALRGDQVTKEQIFRNAKDLVAQIRDVRGDAVSIGVGGYPEGHPESSSLEEDMKFLREKVDAGADFIITQLCFTSEKIVRFIRSCRDNGIKIPIIVGIVVPDCMKIMQRMMTITQVGVDSDEFQMFKELENKTAEFQDHAVAHAVETVRTVLDSGLDVYGFQFFTLNRLHTVKRVLKELQEKILPTRRSL